MLKEQINFLAEQNYIPICAVRISHLSAKPTKQSNTLKQFVAKSQQIVCVCLNILLGWRLKD